MVAIITKSMTSSSGAPGQILDLSLADNSAGSINIKLSEIARRIQFLDLNGNLRNESRLSLGNLNGQYGYTSDVYGAAFGIPDAAWIKIEPVNGVRIGFGATTKISLDQSGNASFTGSITAASGTIGGFAIGATALTAGSGATSVGLDSGGTNPALYAGSATPGSAPFRVTNAGTLTASDASITGSITASSGSIGGWSIGSSTLTGNAVTLDAGNGKITAGNVTIKNNEIDVSSAAITWNSVNSRLSISTDFEANGINGISSPNGNIQTGAHFIVGSNQVVGARGAAVADSTDVTNVAVQLNALLARLRTHGLIAP